MVETRHARFTESRQTARRRLIILTTSVTFRADEVHLETIEPKRRQMIVDQLDAATTRLVDRPNT